MKIDKRRLRFGDIFFTTPTEYTANLRDLASYLIRKITGGPTHCMMYVGCGYIIHMDFPKMKIEKYKKAMQSRLTAKVEIVRPKYNFKQRLRLGLMITKLSGTPLKYSLQELVIIGLMMVRPFRFGVKGKVCSTFISNLLHGIGLIQQNVLTPYQLKKVLQGGYRTHG